MNPSQLPSVTRRPPSPRHSSDHVAHAPHMHWVVHEPEADRGSRHSTGSFRVDESDDDMDLLRANHLQVGEHRCSHPVREKMRRRLKYYFMTPWEKWKARRRFPWKMLLQLVKVVCVTIQLVVFGATRASHVTFLETSAVAFKHLYLQGWDPSYETMPYPPATGKFALYTYAQFFDGVNYAMRRYNETESLAIGAYHFTRKNDTKEPMTMCVYRYIKGRMLPHQQSFEFNSKKITECETLHTVKVFNNTLNRTEDVYDVEKFIKMKNGSIPEINFDNIIIVNLTFYLHTVHLKNLAPSDAPDCYKFRVEIVYDNSAHDGRLMVDLIARETPVRCIGTVDNSKGEILKAAFLSIFDGIVIIISILSMGLCLRSIMKGQKLKYETVRFFKHHYSKELSVYDRLEFLNTWYVLICINDILTIIGSIYKILITNKISHDYNSCGVLLGTGNLLVWFGTLRYLEFYPKYNILILTMKRSAPSILRYLLCAGIFYLGFTFCGWVVLGPYHIKFRELSTASECLFSLVNGDDMFVTFSAIKQKDTYVWWYSRIYLYVFISLFIYVVLSVFISVIMDTYETIKHYYEHGFPKSELFQFIDECQELPTSPLFREDSDSWADVSCFACCFACCCRCNRKADGDVHVVTPGAPDENTRLLS